MMGGSLDPFMSLYFFKKGVLFCFVRNLSLGFILMYLYCYFNDTGLEGHGSFLYLTPFLAWAPYRVPSVTMHDLFLTAASLKYTTSWEEDQKFAWVVAS